MEFNYSVVKGVDVVNEIRKKNNDKPLRSINHDKHSLAVEISHCCK